ncbi:protein involved in sex pheromone biosynthesis [Cytobacillus eiseniae]|uniref:Protein involved in sex pheromone biosynthesis n=1 Tax=Cytobacillus eiseniae TaxID=762947 RepID=A0ABS4RGG8_9BACI|nr:CamS family sex pheromone protein [Cytobacillus eiseniae]MBP2240902.1 protein involved in sex pheromone biosynthesis [Cytobacillus eiseniae]
MKKMRMLSLALILLLAGCAPNFNKQEEIIQDNEDADEKAIIPNYKISDQYYQTLLPFKPSESRGLVVNNINSNYNLTEFETGLMRVAQNTFSTDKYLFQDGQYVKSDQVRSWLNRKLSPQQMEEQGVKEEDNLGLNPLDSGKEETPKYLAHILEHNYLVKNEDGQAKLSGVVVGLALNSVYYYQKVEFGAWYETKIGHAELEKEGKKLAEEVLNRLRKIDELKDVPITIALFEQQSKTSVVPGTFFAYANAAKGSANLGGWEKVDEKYIQFPSSEAMENNRDDATSFLNFKQDVETFFPNFNGVIGKAFYARGQLQELNINIPIQFYGKAEGVGFAQYVAGLVIKHFPNYISVQVSVSSVYGPEALIVRKADQNEPFVHIYQ